MNFANLNMPLFANVRDLFASFRLSLFLILCFVLGGTSQDVVPPKFILYLVSLVLIGACFTVLTKESPLWKMKSLIGVLGAFFLLHLVYLMPLPPSIWSGMPGRDFIAQGYQTLGTDLPWLPLSTTPEKTFFSLFDFLPPFAILMMMGTVVTTKEFRTAIWCIGVFVIMSVVLGLLQLASASSEFYFYDITNENAAVGFFSNANHYGIFLLMTIPIIMCLSDFNGRHSAESNRVKVFTVICIMAALIGVGASGSLGNYLLILPVLVATYFITSPRMKKKSIYLIGIFGSLLAVFLFDMLLWGNLQQELLNKFTSVDSTTRQSMFGNSYDIVKTFFPFGTGPGSFSDIYRLVEGADRRTTPHAHNDYIEMILEFGAFGLAWMALGLFWVIKNIWTAIRSKQPSKKIVMYFSLAIVTVFVHCLVDYSLRTISVMTLFVLSLCVVALSNNDLELIDE